MLIVSEQDHYNSIVSFAAVLSRHPPSECILSLRADSRLWARRMQYVVGSLIISDLIHVFLAAAHIAVDDIDI